MTIDSFKKMSVVASKKKKQSIRIIFETFDGEEHSIELTRKDTKWLAKALKDAAKFSNT